MTHVDVDHPWRTSHRHPRHLSKLSNDGISPPEINRPSGVPYSWDTPIAGWFLVDNPMKIDDDLGIPHDLKAPIFWRSRILLKLWDHRARAQWRGFSGPQAGASQVQRCQWHIWLVVEPPLWQIWVGMILPNVWNNETWQPNHQPAYCLENVNDIVTPNGGFLKWWYP